MRSLLAMALALTLTACGDDSAATVSEAECEQIPIKDLPEDCRQYPGFDELMDTAEAEPLTEQDVREFCERARDADSPLAEAWDCR